MVAVEFSQSWVLSDYDLRGPPKPSHAMKTRPVALIAILKAVSSGAITVENQSGPRLLVLYDRHGQSPCDLEQQMKTTCARPTDLRVLPTSSYQPVLSCTCNVIFFNLWSACLLCDGNPVLPTFGQWSQNCSANSFDVNNLNLSDTVHLPSWTGMSKPSPTNTTFDVGAAIMIAQASIGAPWSALQIITPVLSVIATVILLGCWYLYRNSPQLRNTIWSRRPRLFRRPHRVREGNRSETWTIDLFEDPAYQQDVRPGKTDNEFNTLYNIPISERDIHPSSGAKDHRISNAWKDSLRTAKSWQYSILNFSPVTVVRNVAPSRGWHISSVDHSTESAGLSPRSGVAGAAPSLNHPIFEDDENVELNGPDDAGNTDRETDHLISPSERNETAVFLISRQPGVDFSIESSAGSHISRPATQAASSRTPTATQSGARPRPPQSSQVSSPQKQNLAKHSQPQKPTGASFTFLPKLHVPIPSRLSRSHSNEQISSATLTADGVPRTSSMTPQAAPYSDRLPMPPNPSRVNKSFPKPDHGSQYPSVHRHQPSPSAQTNYKRAPSRDEATFPTPPTNGEPETYSMRTLAPHHRSRSNEDRRLDPTMLFPDAVRRAGYNVLASSSSSAPLYDHRRTSSRLRDLV
ncbi:hypothetical protein AX15_001245 [Amanita polypyramis BW_CC]|nr:hypothetical protein AX15_001245 [Amanita polypyramis BW_CC]